MSTRRRKTGGHPGRPPRQRAFATEPKMPAHGAELMQGTLVAVSPDVVPLYAALTLVHGSLAGKPAGTCVPTCSILAEALGLLGFTAEPMAAFARVSETSRPDAGVWEIGTWPSAPVVRPDWTTNGHMVLWAESFGRLVDPTIAQAPVLLAAAAGDPRLAFPAVIPVPSRSALLSIQPAAQRGRFQIVWRLLPEWTDAMRPLMFGARADAAHYGAVNLARQTVQLLRDLEQLRDDLGATYSTWPRLRALVAGQEDLPSLPPLSAEAAALLDQPSR